VHTFSTKEVKSTPWQEPLMNFPQDLVGFLKLATLMDDMCFPEEHWSHSFGNINAL
jgi:hypothetical protein